MIDYIHRLLLNWGEWVNRKEDGGLGYPSRSNYCNLVHIRSNQDGMALPIEDEDAYEVDGIVRLMKEKNDELWTVVDWFYRRKKTDEQISDRFGFSSATFYRKLLRAHEFVKEQMEENAIKNQRKMA